MMNTSRYLWSRLLTAVVFLCVATVVQAGNVLRIPDMRVASGTVQLPIAIDNDDDITGVQFDLTLPAMVTAGTTPTLTERSNGHTITMTRLSSGAYRVLIYSGENLCLKGDTGTVALLPLTVSSSLTDGTVLTMSITNAVLAKPSGENVLTETMVGKMTVWNDDLQGFINNTPTQATVFTDVVLNQFKATNRTKTIEVAEGRKIRFLNGTLNNSQQTVILVSGQSEVIVDSGAVIRNRTTASIDKALVCLQHGTLTVAAHGLLDNNNSVDKAVVMTADDDALYVRQGATVKGTILNEEDAASHARIVIDEGATLSRYSDGMGYISSTSTIYVGGSVSLYAKLLDKDNVVALTSKPTGSITIKAPQKVYTDSIVSGTDRQTEADGTTWGGYILEEEDLSKLVLDADASQCLSTYFQTNDRTNLICVNYDDLQCFLNGLGADGDNLAEGDGTKGNPYAAYVPCSGTTIGDDLRFKGDDLQYFLLYGQMPGEDDATPCTGTVRQENGNVYVDAGSTVTITHLHWIGCGCHQHIYVTGTLIIDEYIHITNYIRFIHIMPGGHVIIRGLGGETTGEVVYIEGGTVEWHGGSVTGGTYGWYNAGGTISIYGGTISGGTAGGYTGTGGTTHIYGGTITGGLDNYGTTYIHGGAYIEGGSILGTIRNGGTIYLNGGGGNFVLDDIYLLKGCHFYITSTLTIDLRIHVTVDNIVLGEPIVCGGDGYTLTEADCSHITINLPTGYAWRYDPTCHGIVIYSTTGISGVNADTPTVKARYNLLGRRVNDSYKGVVIEQMSNGKRRKAVKK